MPFFSESSLQKLSTCHIDLQTLFKEVIKIYDITILEGHRDKKLQDEAFKNGTSKLQWPNGKHNQIPSLAVDVAPYPIDWKNEKRFIELASYTLGMAWRLNREGKISHNIKWGGNWDTIFSYNDKKHDLIDLPHYEIVIK
jgi:peptidoglycan L-alanyl-D-glutamate endopeptidase CwlK